MEEKKSYSVKELAKILGCSVTAVQKKITPTENNPDLKRYKKRYDVVIKDGKTVILLSDAELEQEKRLSKGFNNVSTTNNETFENVIDVEPTAEITINREDVLDKIINFTNVQMERYETLHKTYAEQLLEANKKINLLTVSDDNKEKECIEKTTISKELEIKNSLLEKRNRLLMLYLTFVTTLLLTFIILFITVLQR